MLDGELAVPCKLQSAIVVSNAVRGLGYGWLHGARNVDSKVPCNVILRTVSELDRSSTKQALACATGKLWRSHLHRFRFGIDYRRRCTVFLRAKPPTLCSVVFSILYLDEEQERACRIDRSVLIRSICLFQVRAARRREYKRRA